MHKLLIFACCAVSVSSASSNPSTVSETSFTRNEKHLNTTFEKVVAGIFNETESFMTKNGNNSSVGLKLRAADEFIAEREKSSKQKSIAKEHGGKETVQRKHHHQQAQNPLPFLHRIHARITRSKNAVWATISLTFVCVLLVLAVAQSRMWKDHYYVEAQGIPLPNFNERVLFKDVMEYKMKSFKQFFKKKCKQETTTELESLLPPSEWDA